MSEKADENKLRRQAQRLGYTLLKSRSRYIRRDNLLGYQLRDVETGTIVSGQRYNLTLADVATYLDAKEDELLEGGECGEEEA